MDSNFTACIQFEHQFWLQILGDHSRFIFNSLSPKETAEIEQAHYYICAFDSLLTKARQCSSDRDLLDLTKESHQEVKRLREFKLHLLCRHLINGIDFHLTPTFVNHMVNELEEYAVILDCLLETGKLPPFHPLHYHNVWLLDAAGHASFIHCSLDEIENDLKEQSNLFKKDFDGLHQKALEFSGYLRTGLESWPALDRLNCQVNQEIDLFQKFLAEMVHLRITLEALGTISPLAPDHMYREECYYLTKLAELGAVPEPKCDPSKPRLKV